MQPVPLPSPPDGAAPAATASLDLAAVRRELADARAALGRANDALERLDEPAGASSPSRPRLRPERYYRVLLGVYEEGRQGLSRERFAALGAVHEYDPRGLGGFFVGTRAALRRDDGGVHLTREGQRLLDDWLATT